MRRLEEICFPTKKTNKPIQEMLAYGGRFEKISQSLDLNCKIGEKALVDVKAEETLQCRRELVPTIGAVDREFVRLNKAWSNCHHRDLAHSPRLTAA